MKDIISRLVILLLTLTGILVNQNISAQGLKLNGLETAQKDRTSYSVFGESRPLITDYLDIKFQLYLYPETNARFGYIMRIKERSDKFYGNIWNVSYERIPEKNHIKVRFNEEGSESLINAEFSTKDLPELYWVDIQLKLSLMRDSVYLKIGEKNVAAKLKHPKRQMRAELYFGCSDYITDVPSCAIRYLSVSSFGWQYNYDFYETEGNTVHPAGRGPKGHVNNPGWLITKHSHWTKEASMFLDSNSGSGYDMEAHRFYYYSRDSLWTYSIAENSIKITQTKNSCPLQIKDGDNFVRNTGLVIAYNTAGHIEPGETTIAQLDLDALEWEKLSDDVMGMDTFHHTSFYDKRNNRYYIFGGSGWPRFNGEFYALTPDCSKWEKMPLNGNHNICPRFFVSSCISGDSAYIFGGMGNMSGEQVIGRKYMYDFHKLDLNTGCDTLLWQLPTPEEDFVPISSMITDGEYAYMLCYPEYKSNSRLSLHRFNISDGSDIVLEDTIPICSDKLYTHATMYLDKELERLFVLTQTSHEDIGSTLDIYSIHWPIMFESHTYEDQQRKKMWILLAAFILILISAGAIVIAIIRYKHKQLEITYLKATTGKKERRARIVQNIAPNSIRVFGEFQVVDNTGNDISETIHGQLRDILLLIMKYSDKKGISSERLSKIIWPDKEDYKVKNSRGVAINRLRTLLAKVDNISIVFEDGHYRLETGAKAFCDYLSLEVMLAAEQKDIDGILDIAGRGKFLAFTGEPIYDTWKARIEEKLSNYLHTIIQSCTENEEWERVLEISDILFSIDPLDEQALQCQIHCLKELHHNEDALVRYAEFSSEYRTLNGEDYPIPFAKI